ncbi:MAG: CHASE2 domain-containing protein [Cyanobacteria bacterium P01_A01_bin.123]
MFYQLTVQKIEQTCVFNLTWGNHQRLHAEVPFPPAILQFYKNWQAAYLGYYQAELRGVVLQDPTQQGAVSPAPDPKNSDLRGRPGMVGQVASQAVNWHSQLAQTEAQLLSEFHRWLLGEPLHKIRQTLIEGLDTLGPDTTLNVFLTCTPIELARLPWETWELDKGSANCLRFARSPINIEATTPPRRQFRKGRARVLAILGDSTHINARQDLDTLQERLKRTVEIESVIWHSGKAITTLKQEIRDRLRDPLGWDILFFAGHSNEQKLVKGEIAIAPSVTLSMRTLEPDLEIAKARGLQFALFNSCSGLDIADALIGMGLSQVAIMREPVHDQVALAFLDSFLQGVAGYEDVHDALIKACRHLRSQQQLTYPSAYFIPSLFRHPSATLFQLEPTGWKRQLRRFMPQRREAIAVAVITTLSLLTPVHYWLVDQRVKVQAQYRQLTQQQPALIPSATTPPVLLVQIDDQSLQLREIGDPSIMDRTYLADLVDQATSLDAPVVALDFVLDRVRPDNVYLGETIQNNIAARQSWFIFATKKSHSGEWQWPLPEISENTWSLRGDMNIPLWNVAPLRRSNSDRPMPFSYQIAVAYQLSQSGSTTENSLKLAPTLQERRSLQSQIFDLSSRLDADSQAVITSKNANLNLITALSYRFRLRWLQPILDFSIAPEQVYQTIPAWHFLDQNGRTLPKNLGASSLQEKIVIIAPGGYDEAGVNQEGEDNFPMPPAIAYWRQQTGNPNRGLTGGEAHSYMIHHYLNQHFIIPIPDTWMVLLTAACSKLLIVILPNQVFKSRWQFTSVLALGTGVYGVLSMQVYISGQLLLPWLLPSLIIWSYWLPLLLENPYESH